MGNIQRESEILQILREKTYDTVENLSYVIHISPSSIRRDLTHLESQGLIQRDHGGASILPCIPGMAPFLSRMHEYKKENKNEQHSTRIDGGVLGIGRAGLAIPVARGQGRGGNRGGTGDRLDPAPPRLRGSLFQARRQV